MVRCDARGMMFTSVEIWKTIYTKQMRIINTSHMHGQAYMNACYTHKFNV